MTPRHTCHTNSCISYRLLIFSVVTIWKVDVTGVTHLLKSLVWSHLSYVFFIHKICLNSNKHVLNRTHRELS